MFNLGFSELILILLIAFLVVGPKDLPKVARALGRGVRSLKGWVREFKDESGLGEAIDELKSAEKEVKTVITEADPRKELKSAADEVKKTADEAGRELRAVQKELNGSLKELTGTETAGKDGGSPAR